MQKFWYHSPVRFYKSLSDLEDMTNPQNTAYFGEKPAFPLEVNDVHRFLIPNYENEVPNDNYFIYCVNDTEEYKIQSVCEIVDGKLKYVTFGSDKNIKGRLEIRNEAGNTIFYSNCVDFIDSTDSEGRKFIKIATKHLYNRNLFDYQSDNDWILTSIPAYCFGITDIDADITTSRTGGNSTLKIRETFLDEIVQYQVIAKGDANLLNFLQVHVTNNNFYIDETQRTCVEKIDRSEFSMNGTLKFTNVKDENGMNISVNYSNLIIDALNTVLSNESKTIIYTDNNNNLILA